MHICHRHLHVEPGGSRSSPPTKDVASPPNNLSYTHKSQCLSRDVTHVLVSYLMHGLEAVCVHAYVTWVDKNKQCSVRKQAN